MLVRLVYSTVLSFSVGETVGGNWDSRLSQWLLLQRGLVVHGGSRPWWALWGNAKPTHIADSNHTMMPWSSVEVRSEEFSWALRHLMQRFYINLQQIQCRTSRFFVATLSCGNQAL